MLVREHEVPAVRRDVDARHPADGRQEMRLGIRVVDGPPRITGALRARAAHGGIGEPPHVKLRLGWTAVDRRLVAAPELRARQAPEQASDYGDDRLRHTHGGYCTLPVRPSTRTTCRIPSLPTIRISCTAPSPC